MVRLDDSECGRLAPGISQAVVQGNSQGDEGMQVLGFLPELEFILQALNQPLQERPQPYALAHSTPSPPQRSSTPKSATEWFAWRRARRRIAASPE